MLLMLKSFAIKFIKQQVAIISSQNDITMTSWLHHLSKKVACFQDTSIRMQILI